MTWPTDDLVDTEMDEVDDDPSQARAQLHNLLLKVQAILAEITAGQTVWHSGNDGTGSALDADTVDGVEAAALAPASHAHDAATDITSGTLPVTRGGTGAVTVPAYALKLGNSNGTAIISLSPGTDDQVLTAHTGVAPTWEDNASPFKAKGEAANTVSFGSTSDWEIAVTGPSINLASGDTLMLWVSGWAMQNDALLPDVRIKHAGVVLHTVTMPAGATHGAISAMHTTTTVRNGAVTVEVQGANNERLEAGVTLQYLHMGF